MSFAKVTLKPHQQNIPITNNPNPNTNNNNFSLPGIKGNKTTKLTLKVVVNVPPSKSATLSISILRTHDGVPFSLVPFVEKGGVGSPNQREERRGGGELVVDVVGYQEMKIKFGVNGGTDARKRLHFGRVFVRLMMEGQCVDVAKSGECVVFKKDLMNRNRNHRGVPWEQWKKWGMRGAEPPHPWEFHFNNHCDLLSSSTLSLPLPPPCPSCASQQTASIPSTPFLPVLPISNSQQPHSPIPFPDFPRSDAAPLSCSQPQPHSPIPFPVFPPSDAPQQHTPSTSSQQPHPPIPFPGFPPSDSAPQSHSPIPFPGFLPSDVAPPSESQQPHPPIPSPGFPPSDGAPPHSPPFSDFPPPNVAPPSESQQPHSPIPFPGFPPSNVAAPSEPQQPNSPIPFPGLFSPCSPLFDFEDFLSSSPEIEQ